LFRSITEVEHVLRQHYFAIQPTISKQLQPRFRR
jgi:hypothetical protein